MRALDDCNDCILLAECNHCYHLASCAALIVPTNLVVRNIDPAVVQALKQAAAAHGRSAEAEHREILRAALCQPARRSLKELLASMPDVGTDEDFNFRQG